MEKTYDYSTAEERKKAGQIMGAGYRMLHDDLLSEAVVDPDTDAVLQPAVHRMTWSDVPDVPRTVGPPYLKLQAALAVALTTDDRVRIIADYLTGEL